MGVPLPEPTEKYYIYSKDAKQSEGEHSQVLQEGPLNTLVSTFSFRSTAEEKVIVLSKTPEPDTATDFDAAYGWSQWLKQFDKDGQFSLTRDKSNAIQSFNFQLKLNDAKWATTFSSSADVLKEAFGDDHAAIIESPGIVIDDTDKQSPLLCCGLVRPTSPLSVNIEELFNYVGLSSMVGIIPSQVREWTAKLGESNYKKRRNAMWFDPSFRLQTTIRLQFALDMVEPLRDLIKGALPGFCITAADVTCRKILTEGRTAKGSIGIDQGGVVFSVDCEVKSSHQPAVKMKAGLEFKEAGITIVLRTLNANALEGVLIWLGEVIAGDLLFIKDIVHHPSDSDKSFEGLSLHQITIGLDTLRDQNKPRLARFSIDFEVAGNFGQDGKGRKPVFLASYFWTTTGPKLGSIQAQLWNSECLPMKLFCDYPVT